MKLSSRARYALRAMIVVAREGKDGTPVNLGTVAERTAISRRYLEQIAISLKSAGLLKAVSGRKGGHLLGKPAEEITLGEIVEAAIGRINIVNCVDDPEDCVRSEACECRCLYVMINDRIREAFGAFTLADLADHKLGEAVAKEIASE